MSATIKILKDDLKSHPELSSTLNILSSRVKEEFDACLYTPAPGTLMAFLNLLIEHKISYETIYENNADLKSSGADEI
jgi:hypothetical protein